jgi:ribose 5-phosphate isomerase B
MRILIASDHAGFELKAALVPHLQSTGYEVEDMGAHTLDPEDDYPDFITPLAKRVAEIESNATEQVFGIILGGSGQGEAMCANRVEGIRAAVYYGDPKGVEDPSLDIITLARRHNDANVLSLGARFLSEAAAKEAVTHFIQTPFSDEARHVRRISSY